MSDLRRNRFIVTCHGSSASNWLAYCLNLHPQIACAHSSAALLAEDPAVFAGDGIKAHLPALRQGYLDRQGRPLSQTYDRLPQNSPHVGTVHTYRLRDLPVQDDRFPPPSAAFRTVNFVRHPLDVVVSAYGQFQDLFRTDLNEFSWTLAKVVNQGLGVVERICDAHGLRPGEFDHICFFAACINLGSLRLDLDAVPRLLADTPDRPSPWGYRGMMRMEDVTRSPAAFAELIERLTDAPELADKPYLDRVFAQGKINTHNPAARSGVLERWADLAGWQRDAFAAFLAQFDLRPSYQELGYDFGFLDG